MVLDYIDGQSVSEWLLQVKQRNETVSEPQLRASLKDVAQALDVGLWR